MYGQVLEFCSSSSKRIKFLKINVINSPQTICNSNCNVLV